MPKSYAPDRRLSPASWMSHARRTPATRDSKGPDGSRLIAARERSSVAVAPGRKARSRRSQPSSSRRKPRAGRSETTEPRRPTRRIFFLECARAERALRMQCRRVRGVGRVRRRVQLSLLELPCDDRLRILALGRDRAREAEGDHGRGLVAGGGRRRRAPRYALRG